ncbi:hypothetical protein OESDEN_24789 [Oesophagostomum dentatum]|uniref:Uncharacterized protein n=1 Tax=Oesophagostomum dentatum TaxID=61180 RepID=A0A0B1RX01_OESDE|nr:hypothetical protein OESDEN_24789 [Oesophagostomum dentatum]
MALPSRKPPVLPMLEEFGIHPQRCLELFARCLQPNTVSVGFETLLLQSRGCFVPIEDLENQKSLTKGIQDVHIERY